jgi:hypothetical protein
VPGKLLLRRLAEPEIPLSENTPFIGMCPG